MDTFEEFFGGHNDDLRSLNRVVAGAQYVDVYPLANGQSQIVAWFTRRHKTEQVVISASPAEIVRAAVRDNRATVRFKS